MKAGVLPKFFESDANKWVRIKAFDTSIIRTNIGAQLPYGYLFRSSYESSSGPPQRESGKKKQNVDANQERIGDPKPVAIERRPELGSLFASLFGFALTFPIGAFGADLWDIRKRVRGGCCLLAAILLGFQSTFGQLLGFGLWSLWRLL